MSLGLDSFSSSSLTSSPRTASRKDFNRDGKNNFSQIGVFSGSQYFRKKKSSDVLWERLCSVMRTFFFRVFSDYLSFAALISFFLHVLMLSISFVPPNPTPRKAMSSQIEVILLNARGDSKPLHKEVIAQTNMEGGGENDFGRALSPFLAADQLKVSPEFVRQKKRRELLESQQLKLLSLLSKQKVNQDIGQKLLSSALTDGTDVVDTESEMARLQAQIDRQISDYNKRPKRLTYGVNAVGASYTHYVDAWAKRVEQLGTAFYPQEARGRYYDSMVVTVEIDSSGKVVGIIMNQKSKHEVLNKAVRDIVYAGAPYGRFTSDMVKEGDILQIIRTWHFTNGELRTLVSN